MEKHKSNIFLVVMFVILVTFVLLILLILYAGMVVKLTACKNMQKKRSLVDFHWVQGVTK